MQEMPKSSVIAAHHSAKGLTKSDTLLPTGESSENAEAECNGSFGTADGLVRTVDYMNFMMIHPKITVEKMKASSARKPS